MTNKLLHSAIIHFVCN